MKCKNKRCNRSFAVGMVFHSLAGVQHAGQRMMPPCDVTFPTAALETYSRWGAPVHRLVTDQDHAETTEEA